MEVDVLIAGSGLAGLHAALNLREDLDILVVTNSRVRECNSYLAQGGITTVAEGDRELFIEDTMRAGEGYNDREVVDGVGRDSMKYIGALIDAGLELARDDQGDLRYTREAAHTINRIAYKGSETGKAIMESLIERVEARGNIRIIEECSLRDLIIEEDRAYGGVVEGRGISEYIYAKKTILATGGIGGLFLRSTNTGNTDGIALALGRRYGIGIGDEGYIQFHPTALDLPGERLFLLSEALRGEGATLIDHRGERFVDELQPRNKVAEAVREHLHKGRVYLDARNFSREYLRERFAGIYDECLKRGLDMARDPLPVIPAQHYYMGGLRVDRAGRTTCRGLYAVGEASCTGLHGRNRLASNSLLEALVYSARAAEDINCTIETGSKKRVGGPWIPWDYRKSARRILIEERGDLKDELFDDRRDHKKCFEGGQGI